MLPFRQPFFTTGLQFVSAFSVSSGTSATLRSYNAQPGDLIVFVSALGGSISVSSGDLVSRGNDGGSGFWDRRLVAADLAAGVTRSGAAGGALIYRGGAGLVAQQGRVSGVTSNPAIAPGYNKAPNHLGTIVSIFSAPASVVTSPSGFVLRVEGGNRTLLDRLTPPNGPYNDGDPFSATLTSTTGSQSVTILEIRSL